MIEEKVLEILRTLFEDDSIDEGCSQKTCAKWDSMNQLNLAMELEDAFDISLEPEDIGQMLTYGEIVRIIAAKRSNI